MSIVTPLPIPGSTTVTVCVSVEWVDARESATTYVVTAHEDGGDDGDLPDVWEPRRR